MVVHRVVVLSVLDVLPKTRSLVKGEVEYLAQVVHCAPEHRDLYTTVVASA